MDQKTRDHNGVREPFNGTGGGALQGGGNLSSLRDEGERLLGAAEDAIRKVMSGDSQEFIRRSRQQGGQ